MLFAGELALLEQHGRTGPGGTLWTSQPNALGVGELTPPLPGCYRRAGPALTWAEGESSLVVWMPVRQLAD